MNFKESAARLRRTFHYPTDEDADPVDSQPEAIDEEEQEDFISHLATENASRNAFFAFALFPLPLIAILPYLPSLFRPQTTVLAFLSITSLLLTGFLVYSLPPTDTGIEILDKRSHERKKKQMLDRKLVDSLSLLYMYLPHLNLALITLLILMGSVTKSDPASFGWIGMGSLPAIVYAVVLVAKLIMASVDPELELSALKYEYKGA